MTKLTTVLSIVTVIAVLIAITLFLQRRALQKSQTQRDFLAGYDFPKLIGSKLQLRYPALSDRDIDAVFEALREWFQLLQANPKARFGMPSRVVDDAWHEFILMTRQYEAFCNGAFGRYVHHEPNDSASAATSRSGNSGETALARTLVLGFGGATATGAIMASGFHPNLFNIDEKLGIADGFQYDASRMAELMMLESDIRRKNDSGCSGGGCSGYSVSASSHSGDGGSGDGGGDGGGGCGGGCGS